MAAPLQPDVWMETFLEKVPVPTAGTDEYRWAQRPLAHPGSFKEGRVAKWGKIRREASNPVSGDYRITSWEVEVDDADGVIRGLLSDAATRIWTGREGACRLVSETGAQAGTTPRTLFRGAVTDLQHGMGRKIKISFADSLGFHFKGTNLEKKLGVPITRLEHPNAEQEIVGRIYPYIWGEWSDRGTVDVNGAAADKGLLPVIDVGDYVLAENGNTPEGAEPVYLAAPSGLGAVVNGTPGTTTIEYVVTSVSPYGETTASAVVTVTNAPNTLTLTDNVELTWGAVAEASEYRVYKKVLNQFELIKRLNANETYVSPETTYTDNGQDSTGNTHPPRVNTAQIDQVTEDGNAFGWGRLIVSLGAMLSIHDVYISDLGLEGTDAKRVRAPASAYGESILAPGHPGWPHANDWIVINGIRMTVIYARGPVLEAHRSGGVTIAVNGCGAYGPNGLVYDEAFSTLQWFINEHVLKNEGEGYRDGDYGPLVTYSNGVPIVKPSAFTAAQARTVAYVGGRGYLTHGWIGDQITVREFLHRYMLTFDFLFADDHHGQVYPFFIENLDVTDTGRPYRDRIEIRRAVNVELRWQDVETKRLYDYFYDPDAQLFRVLSQTYADAASVNVYKESKGKDAVPMYFTWHKPTADDVNQRHVNRFKLPPRLIEFETDLTGLEDENGDQVRVDHNEIDDSGVLKPMLVLAHEVDPNDPKYVSLLCFDLSRYLTVGPTSGEPLTLATIVIATSTLDPGNTNLGGTSYSVGITVPSATI